AAFVDFLTDGQNRLVWGAMTALNTIARAFPERVFPHLAPVMAATDRGSVITKDHGLGVLIGLCLVEGFRQATFPLLLEQLRTCPAKQVPLYAERCLVLIPVINTLELARALAHRFDELEKESQRKRLKKVLVKLGAPAPAG
ncbi:MAG: hypothetical protein AAGB22_14635, partial [Bacteroidota bacterium]